MDLSVTVASSLNLDAVAVASSLSLAVTAEGTVGGSLLSIDFSAMPVGAATSLGGLVFSRASSAGYESGASAFYPGAVGVDVARIATRSITGLRFERGTTNLLTNPRPPTSSPWTAGAGSATPGQLSPDGLSLAVRQQTASGAESITQVLNVAAGSHSASVYVKAGSVAALYCVMAIKNGTTSFVAHGGTAPTNWTRMSLSVTSHTGGHGGMVLSEGFDTTSYGGIAAGARDTIVDFPQIEQGPPTSWVSGTRAAEHAEAPPSVDVDGSFTMGLTWSPDVSAADLYAFNYENPRMWTVSALDYCEINRATRKIRICIGGTLTSLPVALPDWAADDTFVFSDLTFGDGAPTGSYRHNGGTLTSLGTGAVLPPIVTAGLPLQLFCNDLTQQIGGIVGAVRISQ